MANTPDDSYNKSALPITIKDVVGVNIGVAGHSAIFAYQMCFSVSYLQIMELFTCRRVFERSVTRYASNEESVQGPGKHAMAVIIQPQTLQKCSASRLVNPLLSISWFQCR
jgi:hypothetical protein